MDTNKIYRVNLSIGQMEKMIEKIKQERKDTFNGTATTSAFRLYFNEFDEQGELLTCFGETL